MSSDQPANLQTYEMISLLLLTLAKGQNILQNIKDVLVLHPLFHPLSLFRYLTKNQPILTKKHLSAFLEENKHGGPEEALRQFLSSQRKQQWSYIDFLQYIYPYSSATIRQVTHVSLKKYPKVEKCPLNPEIVTAFLLLLTEEICLMDKLEVQKQDSQLLTHLNSKEKLRKILRLIKKVDRKDAAQEEDSISGDELRNFMKAFVEVEEQCFLHLMRRLDMKNGRIQIDKIEQIMRPCRRNKQKQVSIDPSPIKHIQDSRKENRKDGRIMSQSTDKRTARTRIIGNQKEGSPKKQFNEQEYRDQLYTQLANTLNINRKEAASFKAVDPKVQQKTTPLRSIENYPVPQKEAKMKVSIEDVSEKENPKDLFLRYIQEFLGSHRSIEQLNRSYQIQKMDLLKLFKHIDAEGQGVVNSNDLYEYYIQNGGSSICKSEFLLLILKHSHNGDHWLSFSEFSDIFRIDSDPTAQQAIRNHYEIPPKHSPTHINHIFELVILTEQQLLQIRRRFRPQQARYLFGLINCESTGFINYQQLKKWLSDVGKILPMKQLMQVLKRLDKSKNGVVVEAEFVQFFSPNDKV